MVKTTYEVTYEYQYQGKTRIYKKPFDNENQAAQFMYHILDRDTDNLNIILPHSLLFHQAVTYIDSYLKDENPTNYYVLKKVTIHSAF